MVLKNALAVARTFGADNQIRTGDLMLTKHVLYQLSHISRSEDHCLTTISIIYYPFCFVKTFFEKFQKSI